MLKRFFPLALALFALPFVAPAAHAQFKAGSTTRIFHPTAQRNWRGSASKELRCIVWYPAAESAVETPQLVGPPDAPLFSAGIAAPHAQPAPALKQLPLILLSHGTGGSAAQMAWLGAALARAGFLAVAVDHPGNNSNEPLTPAGFILWWERATDLSEVLDGMLADEDFGSRIDRDRIGAAGFSLGGYTVLELAGARTDVSVLYDRCRKNADAPGCSAPEMKALGPGLQSGTQLLAAVRKTSGESLARSEESFRDPRVHAVFAMAPANGEVLTRESLRALRVPLAIIVGNADTIAPPENNADYIQAFAHGSRENILPGGIGHYTFLDTCLPAGKQQLPRYCEDEPGVDRDKVHAQVSAGTIDYFRRALKIK